MGALLNGFPSTSSCAVERRRGRAGSRSGDLSVWIRSARSSLLQLSRTSAATPFAHITLQENMAAPTPRKQNPTQDVYDGLPDIHMNTAKGLTVGVPDIRMATAKGMTFDKDIYMDTAKANTTVKQGAFKVWEKELLESPEVRRKATVAQLCEYSARAGLPRVLIIFHHVSPLPSTDFLDYYFQLLGYIANRKDRRARFDEDTAKRNLTQSEYAQEFKSYRGRERALLRKRRVKLRVDQFQIIAQVGQGGYGEVFLARKADTREVCALKKMKKRTLFKMDEVIPWSGCCSLGTGAHTVPRSDTSWSNVTSLLQQRRHGWSVFYTPSKTHSMCTLRWNTSQEVTSARSSITRAFSKRRSRGSTSARCSSVSMSCTSSVISIET